MLLEREMKCVLVFLLCFVPFGFSSKAVAQETGDLKIQFKLKGEVPEATSIEPTVDVAYCRQYDLVSEQLVVNKANKGIANVFVYVYTGRGATKLDKFPRGNGKRVLKTKGCRFEPHAMIARVGDTITIKNEDAIQYAASLQLINHAPFGFLRPPNQPIVFKVRQPEPAVARVVCNIHPWMHARLLLLDHPFAAISDQNGQVEIRDLPVGKELTFRVYHESGSFRNEIYVNGKKDKWSKNSLKIKIDKGMNDMGVVEVPVGEFRFN